MIAVDGLKNYLTDFDQSIKGCSQRYQKSLASSLYQIQQQHQVLN